jgi:hypothetical protein
MTPFDTALRVQRREVDAVKVSIGAEIERIADLDQRTRQHDVTLRDERALAYTMPFATDAWTARMKAERVRLSEASRVAETRLSQLREQAVEAYGTMRAIEGAADRFKDEAERQLALAEQGRIDDLAAARFIAARRKGRAA